MNSRIAPAAAPYSPAIQSRLDALMKGAPVLLLFKVMARDERLFTRFMDGGLLDRGHLPLRIREIAILRVCALNGAEYEWGVHVNAFSAKAGLTEAEIAATVGLGPAAPGWSPAERLVLELCDALQTATRVEEGLWRGLSEAFGEMALLELLLLIPKYRGVAVLTNALELELEPGAARFPRALPRAAPNLSAPAR
jgi:alkylhydroperoxidase family enzyme